MDPQLQLAFGAFEYVIEEVENLRGMHNVDECLKRLHHAREALDETVMLPVFAHMMLYALSSMKDRNSQVNQTEDQSILNSFEVVDGDHL
jgi:transposase